MNLSENYVCLSDIKLTSRWQLGDVWFHLVNTSHTEQSCNMYTHSLFQIYYELIDIWTVLTINACTLCMFIIVYFIYFQKLNRVIHLLCTLFFNSVGSDILVIPNMPEYISVRDYFCEAENLVSKSFLQVHVIVQCEYVIFVSKRPRFKGLQWGLSVSSFCLSVYLLVSAHLAVSLSIYLFVFLSIPLPDCLQLQPWLYFYTIINNYTSQFGLQSSCNQFVIFCRWTSCVCLLRDIKERRWKCNNGCYYQCKPRACTDRLEKRRPVHHIVYRVQVGSEQHY